MAQILDTSDMLGISGPDNGRGFENTELNGQHDREDDRMTRAVAAG